jgi:hypothetical protein
MKLLLLSLAMGCQAFAFASEGVCQENEPQPNRPYHTESPRLHFMMPPTGSTGRVELAASSAQLDLIAPLGLSSAEVESLLQLRGSVEVMMCSPDGCSHGSMVLRADAVDYDEKTHEIDAQGAVRIEPYRSGSEQKLTTPR